MYHNTIVIGLYKNVHQMIIKKVTYWVAESYETLRDCSILEKNMFNTKYDSFWKKVLLPYFNQLRFPFPKWCFCQDWLYLTQQKKKKTTTKRPQQDICEPMLKSNTSALLWICKITFSFLIFILNNPIIFEPSFSLR